MTGERLPQHGLLRHHDLPDLRQTRPQSRHHHLTITHHKQRIAIIIAIASISVALIAADQAQRANQIAVDTYKHTEEKDSNDLKFAQANMISTWLVSDANGELLVSNDSKTVDVIVNNDSKQPIYNVVLTTGTYQGAGQPFLKGNEFTSSIGTVPPGRYKTRVPYPGSGMHIRIESAITFTDV